MRAPVVIALSLVGLVAGAAAAAAADLSSRGGEGVSSYEAEVGRAAAPITIYDFEPGIVVRAWWRPPWRHRHYFPTGQAHAATMKHELSGPPQHPAKFERTWSACGSCAPEPPQPQYLIGQPQIYVPPYPYRGGNGRPGRP